jgi:tRNA-specific adenosine deaminase 2
LFSVDYFISVAMLEHETV